MAKLRYVVGSLLALMLMATPSQAYWSVIEKSSNEFVISIDEIIESPVDGSLYAYVESGVITKIVSWGDSSTNSYITSYTPRSYVDLDMASDIAFMASIPSLFKVNYVSKDGLVKSEIINHTDRVSVVNSLSPQELISTSNNEPVTRVISTNVNPDYSTSITIAPPVNNNPNQTVEVQVIANGASFTSITTDNTSNPITINNLPSKQYVTLQTIYRDSVGMSINTSPYQEIPSMTADANAPVLVNSRDVVEDKATISAPQNQTFINGDIKSATISFAPIANFDPSKTVASVMIIGPNGSTTAIGIDGSGGTLNVSDLSTSSNYMVKMVIRDINSGEETIINGAGL